MVELKFLLAPDSFKESLSAKEVAQAMERGLKGIFPYAQYIKIPMADGGEGTTEALVEATGGKFHHTIVSDPLGRKVNARFGILGNDNIAVIEMAVASGLELLKPHERNPLITSTYGTGELIKAALDKNIETLIIGVGGSATNDGGAGMVQALGGRLLDINGEQIGFGGVHLKDIVSIDLTIMDKRLKDVKIEVACDVNNPLTGEYGASYIFGPQKGATKEMIGILDKNLEHFAGIIKEKLNKDIMNIPGSGAAGGLGGSLMAFLNGKISPGIDLVLKYTDLEKQMEGVDYVFTGEGKIDGQTIFGKTPFGVAQVAKRYGIPVVAIAGLVEIGADVLYAEGISAIFSIMQGVCNLEEALKNARSNVEITCENIGRLINTIDF